MTEAEMAVERVLAGLTLPEKVGQLLMIGFPGEDLTAETRRLVDHCHPGGLILFGSNIRDRAQVRGLVARLAEAAGAASRPASDEAGAGRGGGPGAGPGIGPLISVDQEGGVVARLTERHGVPVFPGNMAVAAARDSAGLAYEVAFATGRQLRDLGINMNLAPVLDVDTNPANPVIGVRAFSGDPAAVAALGRASIRGFHDAGVASVGKHFPGHGDTSVDSHAALPVVPHDRQRLDRVELVPFREAVAEGVDAVMTAHVAVPALGSRPSTPATLSEPVLTGLLRNEMGFSGVIMTDAIEMKALGGRHSTAEKVERAIGAGADMILVGQRPDIAREAYDAALAAVRAGRITTDRLDESVRRILGLKQRLGLLPGGTGAFAGHARSSDVAAEPAAEDRAPGARELALEVARQATTLVRDREGLLPLRLKPSARLAVISPDLSEFGSSDLGDYLEGRHPNLARRTYTAIRPGPREVRGAAGVALSGDFVILVTASPRMTPALAELVRGVVGSERPVVWVSLWNPHDGSVAPRAGTYVVTYSFRPVSLQALAEALFGEVPFAGRLPERLPADLPPTRGDVGYAFGW